MEKIYWKDETELENLKTKYAEKIIEEHRGTHSDSGNWIIVDTAKIIEEINTKIQDHENRLKQVESKVQVSK